MPAILPVGGTCCLTDCDSVVTVNVPGPIGLPGADGDDGVDGINAFTSLANDMAIPAALGSVTVDVASSQWMAIGQYLAIEGGGNAANTAGIYLVTAKPSTTQATLKNPTDGTTVYTNNKVAGVISAGARVSPSGPEATGSSVFFNPDDGNYYSWVGAIVDGVVTATPQLVT